LLAAAFSFAAACGNDGTPSGVPHTLRFEDATARVGAALADLRDGVALLPSADDRLFDLYAPDHGRSPRICINEEGRALRCENAGGWGIGAGDLHGVAAADLNGDGRTDLYQAVGGGRGFGKVGGPFDRLYMRNATRHFVDVAPTSLPPDPHGRGRAVRVLDYDRDGRLDVLVANARARVGDSRTRLYHQAQDGRFVDRAPDVGLAFPSRAPLVHDLDADRYPDVLIGRRIYWNDSGAAFRATRLRAVVPGVARLVSLATDIDNDGQLDVLYFRGRDSRRGDRYAVDAAGVLWIDLTAPRRGTDEDRLAFSTRTPGLEILRLTHRNSTTEEFAAGLDHRRVYLGPAKTLPRPYGYDLAGAGPVSLDAVEVGTPEINDEGLYIFRPAADRWTVVAKGNRHASRRGRFVLGLRSPAGVADVESHGLELPRPRATKSIASVYLRNLGNRRFTAQPLILRGPAPPATVAFATSGDFDNDGRVDLVLLAAADAPEPADALLWNAGAGAFAVHRLLTRPAMGEDRAAHVWDMDGDGRLDLLLTSNVPGEHVLLRNVSTDANRWLEIVPTGSRPTARQAVGLRVELTGPCGTQVREVGEATLANTSVLPLHFGIGPDGAVGRVRVHWNAGAVDHAGDTLQPNRRHVLREADPLPSASGR
jgi:hypothetical protein